MLAPSPGASGSRITPASSGTGSTTTSPAILSGPTASQPSMTASLAAATAASASVGEHEAEAVAEHHAQPGRGGARDHLQRAQEAALLHHFSFTRSAASRRMISTSAPGSDTLSSAMSGMPMAA